jgi:predicted dehydrogenase
MGAFTSELMLKWAPSCWHPLSHCEAIDSASSVDLVAVCDIDARQLERVRALFPGIHGFFSDYDELLAGTRPDIVCVATRTSERTTIIEHAVVNEARGLHIEKPLCNRMTELESIEKIFDSSYLACTYGTLRRYMPIFLRARDLVQSGHFGPLIEIQVCFGSAPLMWTHPHSFDLLTFFADDADIVMVSGRLKDEGIEREGAYLDCDPIVKSVTIEFATGVVGLITQSGGNDVVLTCRDGSVTIESGGRRIRCRESLGGGGSVLGFT